MAAPEEHGVTYCRERKCAVCREDTAIRCAACATLLCRDHSQVVGANRFCLGPCPVTRVVT
jgi:hypothetical protein